jgi:hypothetical protein
MSCLVWYTLFRASFVHGIDQMQVELTPATAASPESVAPMKNAIGQAIAFNPSDRAILTHSFANLSSNFTVSLMSRVKNLSSSE